MNKNEEEVTAIYNLILNPNTRDWERQQLIEAKESLATTLSVPDVFEKLEVALRPLAIRNNLTPDVMDFYLRMVGDPIGEEYYDYSKHEIIDPTVQERAVFAGGCFWCMVEPFEEKEGILSVLSGYTGGQVIHPNYDQVSGGYTGHVEAVEIIFDTRVISYEELIELYWQLTDPTDEFGQFQDRGNQYRPIIFVQNEEQRQIAERSKQALSKSGRYTKPIVVAILPATTFWPAENYHQQFYRKQPKRYRKIKQTREQLQFFQKAKGNWRKIKK
ncbi:peptide-methionine (S)-S-oxide reductase [Enterococcus sp. 10A9_DIV0425]|uniref:Peptide methionine sulfoxide reductase MsrA n=1 Tax=Candidatus Enterococcus wittei TaxID=1987383 RepID=A0A242K0J0_9ENTE|nr:peptide-methionine (S)-S-oxide reductase MsrA [Enterococcus sp. 10A9_DIV0425]OTP11179.1 peptide-methionine (S)-S-oxide reductase [Enterococcus sp. 10A9_DIV0425]THE10002.1 peptide-methionine (S)-S-oxide reductase [Enterococcus hirae]